MSCAFQVIGLENQWVKSFSNLCCDAIIYSCVYVYVCVCTGHTVCKVPSAAVYNSENYPSLCCGFHSTNSLSTNTVTIEQFYSLP